MVRAPNSLSRKQKRVVGSNHSLQERRENFLLQGQLSVLTPSSVFRYPVHPRVTAVARKRPRSFCQKCGWQVTAKYACILRMWLCMKCRHAAWLYGIPGTERVEMAASSCDTSHASAESTPLRWIVKKRKKTKTKKRAIKKRFTHAESLLSLICF